MNRFARLAAAACLLLAGVYLRYWNSADFFVDDWILLPLFREAQQRGLAGAADLAVRAAQNRIYDVYRMQWLSILYGLAVSWAGGFSIKFNFAALLLLHAANGWVLAQALRRLGAEPGPALGAGGLFVLLPTTRFVLLSYFTNPFFVFSTFWILLLLWRWSANPGGRPAWLAACAVAALFAGEQTFLLLWTILPLAAWTLARPDLRAAVKRAVLWVWGAAGVAGILYLGWISKVSPLQAGAAGRYQWDLATFQRNIRVVPQTWWRLTGLPANAPFRIEPAAADLVLAGACASMIAALLWLYRKETRESGAWRRLAWFGAVGTVLAYLPVLWLAIEPALRYHYVASPFLAVLVAAALRAAGGRAAAGAYGLAAGLLALNAAAEIRQCWIPMASHHWRLRAALASLNNLEPGDLLIVAGAPFEIGTAQHLSLHSARPARGFAETVTGIAPLEVAMGIDGRDGHLTLFRVADWRVVVAPELRRAHVLVDRGSGGFDRPEWIAAPAGGGLYRLLPLKTCRGPLDAAGRLFRRDQLAFLGGEVLFVGPTAADAVR